MRIGIIGGGVIARLFLEHIRRGDMGDAELAAILGRSESSRGKALAAEYQVPYVTRLDALIDKRPALVIEAASHDAVRTHAGPLLDRGIAVMVLSAGALRDAPCVRAWRRRRQNTRPCSTCLPAASAASMRSRRYAWPAPIQSKSP
jgi:aspartate dehydrogenase